MLDVMMNEKAVKCNFFRFKQINKAFMGNHDSKRLLHVQRYILVLTLKQQSKQIYSRPNSAAIKFLKQNVQAKFCVLPVHVDVDECLNETSGCSHLCQNTKGSFYCSCRPGYSLASDERSCDGRLFKLLAFFARFQRMIGFR